MVVEERIKKMENHLNNSEDGLKKIESALEKFKKVQSEIKELDNYYGSEEWFSDIEEYDNRNVSSNVNAGVLSEDAAYDVLMRNREIAIEMLEIATAILKNNN